MLKSLDDITSCARKECDDSFIKQTKKMFDIVMEKENYNALREATKKGNTNKKNKVMNQILDKSIFSKEYRDYVSCMEKKCSNEVKQLYNTIYSEVKSTVQSDKFKEASEEQRKPIVTMYDELVKGMGKSESDKMVIVAKIMARMNMIRNKNQEEKRTNAKNAKNAKNTKNST